MQTELETSKTAAEQELQKAKAEQEEARKEIEQARKEINAETQYVQSVGEDERQLERAEEYLVTIQRERNVLFHESFELREELRDLEEQRDGEASQHFFNKFDRIDAIKSRLQEIKSRQKTLESSRSSQILAIEKQELKIERAEAAKKIIQEQEIKIEKAEKKAVEAQEKEKQAELKISEIAAEAQQKVSSTNPFDDDDQDEQIAAEEETQEVTTAAESLSSEYETARRGCSEVVEQMQGLRWQTINIHPFAKASYDQILNQKNSNEITEQQAITQLNNLKTLLTAVKKNPNELTQEQTAAIEKFSQEVNNKKSFFGRHPILCAAAILTAAALIGGFIALSVMSGGLLPAAMVIGVFATKVAIPIVAHFFVATVLPFLHTAAMAAGAALHGPAMAAVSALKGAAIFTGKFIVANPIFSGVVSALATFLTVGSVLAVRSLINSGGAKAATAGPSADAKSPTFSDTVNRALSKLGVNAMLYNIGAIDKKEQTRRDDTAQKIPSLQDSVNKGMSKVGANRALAALNLITEKERDKRDKPEEPSQDKTNDNPETQRPE